MVEKRCGHEINGEKCSQMITGVSWAYAQEFPWIIPIGIAYEDLNRQFGLNEVEQLPMVVDYKDRKYQLGCITFHISGHFVAIIACENGFGYYDGMAHTHPITTLPEALKLVAPSKPLISHICYFLVPEKKEPNKPTQKSQQAATIPKEPEILAETAKVNQPTQKSQKATTISKELKILAEVDIVKVVAADITTLKVDAIVNAAKATLLGGAGVDGAIHKAAGPQLLEECRKLGGCETGEAKITQAYNMKNVQAIIHTVGPRVSGAVTEQNEVDLYNCYYSSLTLAAENGLRSIAFPAISTGIYGYPKAAAAKIATEAVKDYLNDEPQKVGSSLFYQRHNSMSTCCYINEIIFGVYDNEDKKVYKNQVPKAFQCSDE